MNARTQQILGEAKNKMNGYVMLLMLRYSNLCVKADAMSLLSVTVMIDDQEKNIEEVATIGMQKEDVIAVAPKFPNILFDIGKGVMTAHPEFKMDVVQKEDSKYEDDLYLTFTMPEVDQDRRNLLIDGVDGLYKQCKAKLDEVREKCNVEIGMNMVGAEQEEIDATKDQLKQFHDFFKKTLDEATDTKKKEIEDAYQLYLEEQQQKEAAKKETEEAVGKDRIFSMKMTEKGM